MFCARLHVAAAVLATAFVAACASEPIQYGALDGPPARDTSRAYESIYIASVDAGRGRFGKTLKRGGFRDALEGALTSHNLLTRQAKARFALSAEVTEVLTPAPGQDKIVTVRVQYDVRDLTTGGAIYVDEVMSQGVADPSEDGNEAKLTRRATERAVAENVNTMIAELRDSLRASIL